VEAAIAVLRIEHGVRDYDTWKAAFDSDPAGRAAGGVRRYSIARPSDDPGHVIVDLEFDTPGEAESFGEKLRALWGGVGGELGLEGATARVLDVVEVHEL